VNGSENDVLLTTEQMLKYLRVNQRTIYRLIKAGTIPVIRVGGQWRFSKREVDAWLTGRAHTESTTPEVAPAHACAAPPRVLVLDDASIRELLSKALALAGSDIAAMTGASTADNAMLPRPYDALVGELETRARDGLRLTNAAGTVQADLRIEACDDSSCAPQDRSRQIRFVVDCRVSRSPSDHKVSRGRSTATKVKGRRGFASMNAKKRRRISRQGGIAAHKKGTAHEFTAEEARTAGTLGASVMRRRRASADPSTK